ncbi:Mur ligase domain-containing protein [Nocardioides sp. B-3]|nr:Mur ligase domain-containing protein [Nocardioides sp. B-3]UUZ59649.1 Mur ligase domain-containing protein [Nocardioides sp. B-3]
MPGDPEMPPAALPGRPGSPTATELRDLAAWLETLTPLRVVGAMEAEVTGISLSSQRIQPGDLYAALPGARAHGADFAVAAPAAGAVGVLTDPAGAALLPPDTAAIVVDQPRRVLGRWRPGSTASPRARCR